MFDLVISGGDSFTFGAELQDSGLQPHPNSWANLVAERIAQHHINVARSARSNSYITRHVIRQLQSAIARGVDPKNIFVQVMWTFVDRHEFAIGIPTGEYDTPWMYITPYSDVDETESAWFKSVDPTLPTWEMVRNSLKSFYNKNKQLGIVDFVKHYKRLTQSSGLNDSYTSLKEILLLQNTLKLHNVPYLFTYVNQHVMHGVFEEENTNCYLNSTRQLIDVDCWFDFPGDFQTYVGFDDWAKHNGYSYGTSHPLEAAHAGAADVVYQHIKRSL